MRSLGEQTVVVETLQEGHPPHVGTRRSTVYESPGGLWMMYRRVYRRVHTTEAGAYLVRVRVVELTDGDWILQ